MSLRPLQPRLDPFLDHGPLELGEHAHHLEQGLPCRCRGVDALLVEVEVNPKGVEFLPQNSASTILPIARPDLRNAIARIRFAASMRP